MPSIPEENLNSNNLYKTPLGQSPGNASSLQGQYSVPREKYYGQMNGLNISEKGGSSPNSPGKKSEILISSDSSSYSIDFDDEDSSDEKDASAKAKSKAKAKAASPKSSAQPTGTTAAAKPSVVPAGTTTASAASAPKPGVAQQAAAGTMPGSSPQVKVGQIEANRKSADKDVLTGLLSNNPLSTVSNASAAAPILQNNTSHAAASRTLPGSIQVPSQVVPGSTISTTTGPQLSVGATNTASALPLSAQNVLKQAEREQVLKELEMLKAREIEYEKQIQEAKRLEKERDDAQRKSDLKPDSASEDEKNFKSKVTGRRNSVLGKNTAMDIQINQRADMLRRQQLELKLVETEFEKKMEEAMTPKSSELARRKKEKEAEERRKKNEVEQLKHLSVADQINKIKGIDTTASTKSNISKARSKSPKSTSSEPVSRTGSKSPTNDLKSDADKNKVSSASPSKRVKLKLLPQRFKKVKEKVKVKRRKRKILKDVMDTNDKRLGPKHIPMSLLHQDVAFEKFYEKDKYFDYQNRNNNPGQVLTFSRKVEYDDYQSYKRKDDRLQLRKDKKLNPSKYLSSYLYDFINAEEDRSENAYLENLLLNEHISDEHIERALFGDGKTGDMHSKSNRHTCFSLPPENRFKYKNAPRPVSFAKLTGRNDNDLTKKEREEMFGEIDFEGEAVIIQGDEPFPRQMDPLKKQFEPENPKVNKALVKYAKEKAPRFLDDQKAGNEEKETDIQQLDLYPERAEKLTKKKILSMTTMNKEKNRDRLAELRSKSQIAYYSKCGLVYTYTELNAFDEDEPPVPGPNMYNVSYSAVERHTRNADFRFVMGREGIDYRMCKDDDLFPLEEHVLNWRPPQEYNDFLKFKENAEQKIMKGYNSE